MTNPARRLLGGHAYGTLTREEKKALYSAALEDQDLFDTLVEDEALREALTDPAVRRELLAELEKPTFPERVRAFFNQPATLAHLSVATAVLFVAFASWVLVGPGPHPLRGVAAGPRAAAAPGDPRAAVFALPLREAAGVSVAGSGPQFSLAAPAGSRALVLEKKPGGEMEQLFPASGGGSGLGPGATLAVAGGREPGVHRVRFLVAPADLEPLSLDARGLRAALPRMAAIERVYSVEGGP